LVCRVLGLFSASRLRHRAREQIPNPPAKRHVVILEK
jgi:hypothetical protein